MSGFPAHAPVAFDRSSAATGPAFTQQIMQKLREQAQELGNLRNELDSSRSYARLCEQRILDLAPSHPLPVSQTHIGQTLAEGQDPGHVAAAAGATNSALRQELQEQKLYIQMLEDEVKANASGSSARGEGSLELLGEVKKLREEASRAQDLLLQQRRHGERLERELQNALYRNAQARGDATLPPDAQQRFAAMQAQVTELETEKNALLGYVQDNMQRSAEMQQQLDAETSTLTREQERAAAAEARLGVEEAQVAQLREAASLAERRLQEVRKEGLQELASAGERYEQLYRSEKARADALAQQVANKDQEVKEIVGLHGEYITSAEQLQNQYQAEVQARAKLAGEARSLQTNLELAHDQHAAAQAELVKELEAAQEKLRERDATKNRLKELEAQLSEAAQREARVSEDGSRQLNTARTLLVQESAELRDAQTAQVAANRATEAAVASEERLRAELGLVRKNAELEQTILKGKIQLLQNGDNNTVTSDRGRDKGYDTIRRIREMETLREELAEAKELLEKQESDLSALRAQARGSVESNGSAAAKVAHEVIGVLREEFGHVHQNMSQIVNNAEQPQQDAHGRAMRRRGVRRGQGLESSRRGAPPRPSHANDNFVDRDVENLRTELASLQKKHVEQEIDFKRERIEWQKELQSIASLQAALEEKLANVKADLRNSETKAAVAKADATRAALEAESQITALQRELSSMADEVCL